MLENGIGDLDTHIEASGLVSRKNKSNGSTLTNQGPDQIFVDVALIWELITYIK